MAFLASFYVSVSNVYQWSFRIFWSLSLCYILFACVRYGGAVNWVLSLPQWQPLSRLNFAGFLVHTMVLIAIKVNMRNGFFFSNFTFVSSPLIPDFGYSHGVLIALSFQIQLYVIVCLVTFVISTIITLTIEMPIAALQQRNSLQLKEKQSYELAIKK